MLQRIYSLILYLIKFLKNIISPGIIIFLLVRNSWTILSEPRCFYKRLNLYLNKRFKRILFFFIAFVEKYIFKDTARLITFKMFKELRIIDDIL